MARVTAPDMEMWVVNYLRATLTAEGESVQVSNKEPASLSLPLTKPLIVVRDDSGPRASHVTFDRSLGVNVLAGTRLNDLAANTLARKVMAILTDEAIIEAPGSPIASIEWDGCNGPYPVTENLDVARRYGTVQYTVIGSW